MKNQHLSAIAILLIFFTSFQAKAQGTFSSVNQVLQSNCTSSGCHNPTDAAAGLNFSANLSDVYSALVNKAPQNQAAAAKGNKLVAPGDPQRSFLLRKIAHGISSGLNLDQAEKDSAPGLHPILDDKDIELVRQWILFGAPDTGNVVDTGLIYTYYRIGGIDDTYGQHDAPNPSEGFQVYLGKIFVPPFTEFEYYIKYDTKLSLNTEVHKVETFLPSATHHFIVYKFFPAQSARYKAGLRGESLNSHGQAEFGFTTGANKWDYDLPNGTAYFWAKNLVLDLNLHIRNTNPDSILACDLYINVYTQAEGTADYYMFSANYPNYNIPIPHDGNEHTFEVDATDPNATKMWNIWKLTTHTHRYGIDYDVWLRNSDGSKSDQVYEGFYDYEAGFNTGFYRWGPDVTIRTYDGPFLEVNPQNGFIQRAKFINTAGPDTVKWGLTSLDEMMVLNIQYFEGAPLATGIENTDTESDIALYPNPSNGTFELKHLSTKSGNVLLEIFNAVGERVAAPLQDFWSAGTNKVIFNGDGKLSAGMYFVKLSFDGSASMKKIILTL